MSNVERDDEEEIASIHLGELIKTSYGSDPGIHFPHTPFRATFNDGHLM